MRILHRYIAHNLFSTFLTSLLVLSFVMMIGLLFKATKYIADGASFMSVLQFLGFGFPGTLSISIPVSALVSTMLVFGRLSADSEISAMRACGVSMRRIMLTPFVLGVVLSAVCVYITGYVAPDSSYARKTFRRIVSTSDVLAVIQPGKSIAGLPGLAPDTSVFVGTRTNEWLYNVRIQEPLKNGSGVRDIRAESARVVQNTNGTVRLEMFKAVMSPLSEDRPGVGQADRFQYTLGDDLSDRSELPPRRMKDMETPALRAELAETERHMEGLRKRIAETTGAIAEMEADLAERTRMRDAFAAFVASLEDPSTLVPLKDVEALRGLEKASDLKGLVGLPGMESDGDAGDDDDATDSPALANLDELAELSLPATNVLAWTVARVERAEGRLKHLRGRRGAAHKALKEEFVARSRIRTEWSNRLVLALASLCFIAVAAPYGLKGQRRESPVGTIVCLGVSTLYYLFLVATESLAKHPEFHPDLIAWVPVALCLVLSLHGIGRNT